MSLWVQIKRRIFVSANVKIGANFHIGLLSWMSASEELVIGDDVLIGKFCTIQCNGSIGDGTMIANNVGIVGRLDHDFNQIGTLLRHARHVSTNSKLSMDPRNWIDIGSDVWIGYGSKIVSGVKIGRGAVIGAGSVIARNIRPYEIVVGNPARTVGRRFTDEEIVLHEAKIARARRNRYSTASDQRQAHVASRGRIS